IRTRGEAAAYDNSRRRLVLRWTLFRALHHFANVGQKLLRIEYNPLLDRVSHTAAVLDSAIALHVDARAVKDLQVVQRIAVDDREIRHESRPDHARVREAKHLGAVRRRLLNDL